MFGSTLRKLKGKLAPMPSMPQRRKSNFPSARDCAVGELAVVQRAADPVGAQHHAESLVIDLAGRDARLAARQLGRRHAELRVAAHHLELLSVRHVLLGLEIADFRGHAIGQAAGVERLNQPHAAAPLAEGLPEGISADPDRADDANTRNDHFLEYQCVARNDLCCRQGLNG